MTDHTVADLRATFERYQDLLPVAMHQVDADVSAGHMALRIMAAMAALIIATDEPHRARQRLRDAAAAIANAADVLEGKTQT